MQIDKSWELLNFFIEQESKSLLKFPFYFREKNQDDYNTYEPYQSFYAEMAREDSLNISEMSIKKYCKKFKEKGILNDNKKINYKHKSEVILYSFNVNKDSIFKTLSILYEKLDDETFNRLFKNVIFHYFLSLHNFTDIISGIQIRTEIDLLYWNPEESPKVYDEINEIAHIFNKKPYGEFLTDLIREYIHNGKSFEEWNVQYKPNIEIKTLSDNGPCRKSFNPYQIEGILEKGKFKPKVKPYCYNQYFSRLPIHFMYPSCHQEVINNINERLLCPLLSLLHVSPRILLQFFSEFISNKNSEKRIDFNSTNHLAVSIESPIFAEILKESIICFLQKNVIDKENLIQNINFGDDMRYLKYRKEIERGNLFSLNYVNDSKFHFNIHFFSYLDKFKSNASDYPINIKLENYNRFQPDDISNPQKIITAINEKKIQNLQYLFSFFSHRSQNFIRYIDFSAFKDECEIQNVELEFKRMISFELNRICNNIDFCNEEIFADPSNGFGDYSWEKYYERIKNRDADNGEYGESMRAWWEELSDANYFSIKKILEEYRC